MGKLFKFRQNKDAAARVENPGKGGNQEAADRLRSLIKSEYKPEQVEALRQLQTAEAATRYTDGGVNVAEVASGAGPDTDMLRVIAEQTGLRMIDLRLYPRANVKLRSLISAEQATALGVIPVEEMEDGTVVVAISDPSNPTIADDLRLILGTNVETVIANEDEIRDRLQQYYGMGDQSIEDLVNQQNEEEADEDVIGSARKEVDLSDMQAISNDQPIVKFVKLLLMRAVRERASDLHLEPFPTFIRIRNRVDGVLREIPAPPRDQYTAIISALKVMSGMDIAETRLPQDGRIKLLTEGNREVDLRVASVPTVHGESLVMRVLDKSMMMIGISNIGMSDETLDTFMKLIRRPNGIVLVTGPTGCGKTTTLYSALSEIQDPGEKIITTEDPVEYELMGIQQVNINENVGLTYARSLRAILRQDPDIVLVGEIRDVETAQVAVQAALTGHLVFSTLHTNSACATITRMLDMGVEPFLITSALEGVIGQRLVRTICQTCKRPHHPTVDELNAFGVSREEIEDAEVTFYHGEGCGECNHTGYHGRMGIYELLMISDEIRDLILERATTDEVQELALRQGMISMRQDGWIKACMGMTTLAEIERQTPRESLIGGSDTVEETDDEHDQLADQPARGELPEPEPEPGNEASGSGEEAQRLQG